MENKAIIKKYSNSDITVVWEPAKCIHSTVCWKEATGLPTVFNPRTKPWINLEGSDTETIKSQVNKCPSGALSWIANEEKEIAVALNKTEIEVSPNGPLMVFGPISIKTLDGVEHRENAKTAFCRCGHSGNKPFCDGSHRKVGFEG
jgi:uncharacterized Fe-S cluster protein YjdI